MKFLLLFIFIQFIELFLEIVSNRLNMLLEFGFLNLHQI